ncbi:MAG: hypothetical protein RLN88_10770 [Ekhidna sp.]|uniref:hypothetical protein n=1 Tax=Ekhidna sp. TaxID=2608089 RepID=UPI0032EE9DDC
MKSRCISGKLSFAVESLAIEALIQNHIRNSYRDGQGPVNIYLCEDCGEWHFTSKGSKHHLLNDPEVRERIDSERRAYEWEQRLK